MDTETHSDNGGINIGSRNLDAGTVGIHHGDIIVASAAKYCAIIALAADFVGVRAAAHEGPVSHAGHDFCFGANPLEVPFSFPRSF